MARQLRPDCSEHRRGLDSRGAERRHVRDEDRLMTAIRTAQLAGEALLAGPPVFRVNGIVRKTLTSGSVAALPSDVVVHVVALVREALLAGAGTFGVAVAREALVSEAEAPPLSDAAPRFWTTILA